MKILMCTWKSFGDDDLIEAFESQGISVIKYMYDKNNGDLHRNEEVQKDLESRIREESPDFVFTFNYYPVIASACKECDTRYVSWIYDSPVVLLYSFTVIYPTNYIFVFDSDTYLEFHNQGISTVYYLPLAANPDRLMAMQSWESFEKTIWYNQTDIAFVGAMYTEKHDFFSRMKNISDYTTGYLEGIMEAQRNIYGMNFIEQLLTEDIMDDMHRDLPLTPSADSVERRSWLFAQYVVNRRITAIERNDLLREIGSRYKFDLYTPNRDLVMAGAINHGPVDYYDMAPYVFKKAKINLNISLRSIVNGIPLRCFDILGNGGFLLSNYQGDFLQLFAPGEDVVLFEDKDDMLNKLAYYLAPENKEERAAIASNGLKKVREAHTYKHRVLEIMDTIG